MLLEKKTENTRRKIAQLILNVTSCNLQNAVQVIHILYNYCIYTLYNLVQINLLHIN